MHKDQPVQLLRDANSVPVEQALQIALGPRQPTYASFLTALASLDVSVTWRYYRDVKSWLAKGVYKKRTVCWISVWEDFFRVSFYIPARLAPAVGHLGLSPHVNIHEPAGKLLPVMVDVADDAQVGDLVTLARYRISLF